MPKKALDLLILMNWVGGLYKGSFTLKIGLKGVFGVKGSKKSWYIFKIEKKKFFLPLRVTRFSQVIILWINIRYFY